MSDSWRSYFLNPMRNSKLVATQTLYHRLMREHAENVKMILPQDDNFFRIPSNEV